MTKQGDKRMEEEKFFEGLSIININDPTEDLKNK